MFTLRLLVVAPLNGQGSSANPRLSRQFTDSEEQSANRRKTLAMILIYIKCLQLLFHRKPAHRLRAWAAPITTPVTWRSLLGLRSSI